MFLVPQDGSNELPQPIAIYERLRKLPEHELLQVYSPHVAFLFREGGWLTGSKTILGKTYMPRVQGDLRPLFEWLLEVHLGYFPVYLFVLNADWWRSANDRQREVLVFHEMLHCGQAKDMYGAPRFHRETGEPVWCIRQHDLEEFNEVVARYGAWAPDVQAFLDAAKLGGVS